MIELQWVKFLVAVGSCVDGLNDGIALGVFVVPMSDVNDGVEDGFLTKIVTVNEHLRQN
jgi:hypothetical protein